MIEVVQAEDAGGLEGNSGIVWIQEHLGLGRTRPGLANRLDLRVNRRERSRVTLRFPACADAIAPAEVGASRGEQAQSIPP